MKIRLFLDSGAPTLYNKYIRRQKNGTQMGSHMKDRKHDDYTFLKDKLYLDYRNQYMSFIKEHEKELELYINLDIINNPQATWDNQMYFEKKGLHPIPVYHFGSPYSWLKKYLDAGYSYIAIGGMVPNPTSVLRPGLDYLWSEFLTDKKGYPKVRVHGFAATSVELMTSYPWYSVDSTSWAKHAIYGAIMLPKKKDGEYVYNKTPNRLFVSTRKQKVPLFQHISSLPLNVQKEYIQYIEKHGYKLGRSAFKIVPDSYKVTNGEVEMEEPERAVEFFEANHLTKIKPAKGQKVIEVIEELGLSNSFALRCFYNIEYFQEINRHLPKWPWAIDKRQRGLFI